MTDETKSPVSLFVDKEALNTAIHVAIGQRPVEEFDDDTIDEIVKLYVARVISGEAAKASKPKWWTRSIAGALVFVGGLFFIGLILRAAVEFFAWGYTVPDMVNGWFGF